MPRLTLTNEQAKTLAGWLRIAAVHLEKQADHLKSCGQSFADAERTTRDEAARAAALAKRLSG